MSLTDKTVTGFFWAFLEHFGVQLLQVIIFIILARVLSPDAFGLMGMLAVFIAISQSLTDSGFGQALIQKKDTDEIDFSSVFYINLVVSILIYGILFGSAPLIAAFYGETVLIDLIRVLGLKFIIASFSMVQIAKLTKEVNFKRLMIAKLPSTLVGGITGIAAAYSGFGVWSLVIQQLMDATIYSVQVWIQSNWRPIWVFNFERIKSLFDFGSKLMLSGIIDTIYQNIYEVVIGRFFSAAQVGFYTQANKIRKLPVVNISSALSRVTFPVLSEIQNDDVRLKWAYKRIVRQVLFFIAPIMIGAIVIAGPLFRFALTEKWMPAVPYFQWLCISGLFYPLNSYNLNILKVKGRSDLFLRLEFIKKFILTIAIIIALQFSVLALVIVHAITSMISFFINSYYSGSFLKYGIWEQIKDINSILIAAVLMGVILYAVNLFFVLPDFIFICTNIVAGAFLYLVMIRLLDQKLISGSKELLLRIVSQ